MEPRQTPTLSPLAAGNPLPDEPMRPRRQRGLVGEIVDSLAASIREGQIALGEKLPT